MKTTISLITIIALFTLITNAQGIRIGLRGGVNFQNINGQDAFGDDLKNDILTGFNLGVNAEIPFAPEFFFQPGLLFTTKGAKSKFLILGQTITSTTTISYLELPLNMLFKPLLGSGHFLLGFGPYVAYGISGTVKQEGGGTSQSTDIKFKNTVTSNDPDDVAYLKALDFGANIFAGYEFSNNLSFQLNAQLGLTDINSQNDLVLNDKTSLKNTGFGFSAGYKF